MESHRVLDEYLKKWNTWDRGVDTRAITKKFVHGAPKACLSTEGLSDEEALQRAQSGRIVGQVSSRKLPARNHSPGTLNEENRVYCSRNGSQDQ